MANVWQMVAFNPLEPNLGLTKFPHFWSSKQKGIPSVTNYNQRVIADYRGDNAPRFIRTVSNRYEYIPYYQYQTLDEEHWTTGPLAYLVRYEVR